MKRLGAAVFFVVLATLALLLWPRRTEPRPPTGNGAASVARPAARPPLAPSERPGAPVDPRAAVTAPVPRAEERSHLADDLNAPGSTIERDLTIVEGVLQAWQTNFPPGGNPVGENAEITAALTGRNPLGLALIPPDHPALNARGELCDRWGTPFFFHQLSVAKMEIRSAGPDHRLYTADDVVLPAPE
jgi:hypothetical protein